MDMAIRTKKNLTSPSGFDQMRIIVREEVAVQVRQALEEQLVFLPTKNEFFSKMDEVLGEVKGMREEFAAH